MTSQRKCFFLTAIAALALVLSCGCQKPLYKQTEFLMGTFVEVRSRDARASAIVFEEFRKLEEIFNIFDPESELSRLNKNQSAVVSEPLFAILKEAREFHRASAGAFDAAIRPLTQLWKKSMAKKELPGPEDVREALSLAGSDNIYLNEDTREVRLLKSGASVDLGGIVKGFALDRAVEKLKESRIDSVLVNAGGNVFCLGANGSRPWRAGIQDPFGGKKVLRSLVLEDQAASTSGDYQQYFELDGKRFSHIIDPRTGYPADSGVVSATLVSADASTGDALSTACVVLGVEKSREMLAAFPGVKAFLITSDGVIHAL
ncbi:MAG: FAD:protein FMN transferase [Candidatus Omnitrophota bacterium]